MVGLLSLQSVGAASSMPKSGQNCTSYDSLCSGNTRRSVYHDTMPESSCSSFNGSCDDDDDDWLPSFSEPQCVLIYKEGRFTFEDVDLPSPFDGPSHASDTAPSLAAGRCAIDTNFFQEPRYNSANAPGSACLQAPLRLDDGGATGKGSRSNLIRGIKEKIKGCLLEKKSAGSSTQQDHSSTSGSTSCSGTTLSLKHSEKHSSQSASTNRTALRRWSAKLRKAGSQ